MRNIISIVFIVIFINTHCYSQSIRKVWYSKEFDLCLDLVSSNHSKLNSYDNLKSRYYGNTLKIMLVSRGRLFGPRLSYKYNIEKLTDNELIISPKSDDKLELIWQDRIVFKVSSNVCK